LAVPDFRKPFVLELLLCHVLPSFAALSMEKPEEWHDWKKEI